MMDIEISIDLGPMSVLIGDMKVEGRGSATVTVDRDALSRMILGVSSKGGDVSSKLVAVVQAPEVTPPEPPKAEAAPIAEVVPSVAPLIIETAPIAPPAVRASRAASTKTRAKKVHKALSGNPFNRFGVTYRRTKLSELSTSDAAKLFSATDKQVEDERLRLGIGAPPLSKQKPLPEVVRTKKRDLTDVSDAELRDILSSTRRLEEIAAEFGVSSSRIGTELRRLGIRRA